jgi:hypothetical protein
MTLQQMHRMAKDNDVPLAELNLPSIENALNDNYNLVQDKISNSMLLRRLWMEWAEYRAYIKIKEWMLVHGIQYRPNRNDQYNEVEKRRQRLLKKIDRSKKIMADLKDKMQDFFSSQDELNTFIEAYKYLDDHYIHESHQPFNGLFMGAETMEENDIKRPHRTTFFKPSADFKERNKELYRIKFTRGKTKKIDIDEFDVLKAELFEIYK